MFELRMHPGCLQTIFLLENGIHDDKLMLHTELSEKALISNACMNTMSPKALPSRSQNLGPLSPRIMTLLSTEVSHSRLYR